MTHASHRLGMAKFVFYDLENVWWDEFYNCTLKKKFLSVFHLRADFCGITHGRFHANSDNLLTRPSAIGLKIYTSNLTPKILRFPNLQLPRCHRTFRMAVPSFEISEKNFSTFFRFFLLLAVGRFRIVLKKYSEIWFLKEIFQNLIICKPFSLRVQPEAAILFFSQNS